MAARKNQPLCAIYLLAFLVLLSISLAAREVFTTLPSAPNLGRLSGTRREQRQEHGAAAVNDQAALLTPSVVARGLADETPTATSAAASPLPGAGTAPIATPLDERRAQGDAGEIPAHLRHAVPTRVRPPGLARVTTEACYQAADESETCTYTGPMCMSHDDWYHPNMVVAFDSDEAGEADPSLHQWGEWSYDERWTTPVDVNSNRKTQRLSLDERMDLHAAEDVAGFIDERLPRMPATGVQQRGWGPALGGYRFQEVDPDLLQGSGAAPGTGTPEVPEILWLDGPMYVVRVENAWIAHVYHFMTSALAMFAARRANRTAWSFGTIQTYHGGGQHAKPHVNRVEIGSWNLPPMSYALFAGAYKHAPAGESAPRGLLGWDDLIAFVKGVWPLLTQRSTVPIFNGEYQRWGVGKSVWLCAPGGVALGHKPRYFSGVADATAFRLGAWALANLTANRPTDTHPPRRIVFLPRGLNHARRIANSAAVLAMLEATGLPVDVYESLGSLSWAEQVRLMAGAGIVVAAHGGQLANLMFLPAHAVVIEIFPYKASSHEFSTLANAVDVIHYPLFADKPPREVLDSAEAKTATMHEVYLPRYIGACEGNRSIAFVDGRLFANCREYGHSSGIWAPLSVLNRTLWQALHEIGCSDFSRCRERRVDPITTVERDIIRDLRTGEEVDAVFPEAG